MFYENHLLNKINAGKASYLPFYNSEEEVESPPSSEDEDSSTPRWCTVRKNINVNIYGKATAYIGLRFSKKTGKKYYSKFYFNNIMFRSQTKSSSNKWHH